MISKEELNRRTRLYIQIANENPETNKQFVLTCIKLAMHWYPVAPEEGQKYWAEVYLKRYTPEEAKKLLEDDLKINNTYNNEGKNNMSVPCSQSYYEYSENVMPVMVAENVMSVMVEDYYSETAPYTPPIAVPEQILVSDGTGYKAKWIDPPKLEAQKTEELITKIKKETHASLTTLVETRIQVLAEKAECSKLSSTSMDFSKYLTAKNEMEKLYNLFQDWIKTIG